MAKKYVKITVKNRKTGKLQRVNMEASKAAALRKKRSTSKTQQLIPSTYRPSVDAGAIDAAVASHIGSLNAPLDQLKTDASTQFDTNVRMSDQLGEQTQATLDQLVRNADQRTGAFQQLAGQGIAAQQQTNGAAATAMARALGGAMSPLVAQMADANNAPMQAQQHAQGVGDVWAQTLASGAQRDFFERGKGISAITQQAFNQGQRNRLTETLGRIAQEQRANQQKRAELVRKFAQEDAQFDNERRMVDVAANKDAAELELDRYNAETGRIDALNDGSSSSGGSVSMSDDQRKAVLGVKKFIDDQLKKLGTVRATEGAGAKKENLYWTQSSLFPSTGGKWREAHSRLTAPEIGMSADQAAMFATRWFKDSIARSTPKKIKSMLESRGVTPTTQRQIIMGVWGRKGWDTAVGRAAAAATANDPDRQQGTYMPAGTQGNISLWADKQLKAFKGKAIKPSAAPTRTFRLTGFANVRGGSWKFVMNNGKTVYVKAQAGQSPVNALVTAIRANRDIVR